MSPQVLALLLLAALLHASWNALVKGGGDALTRLTLVNASAALVTLPLLGYVTPPAPASWPWLLGSMAVHQLYYLFLILAYRAGDLSQVYPIARGMAPLLVALGGWLVAGERLGHQGLLAISLISLAIFSLTGERRRGLRLERAAVYALCTGVGIAAYTVLDGMGGRRAGTVLGYIVWLFVLEGLPLTGAMLWWRGRRLLADSRCHWRSGLLGGVCAVAAYGIVIWAMTQAPLSYVSALRETSVIVAALLGSRWLREPFGRRRIGAAAVVALGVVLLELSRPG